MREIRIEQSPSNHIRWNLIFQAFLLFVELAISCLIELWMTMLIPLMVENRNQDNFSITATIYSSFYYGYILALYPVGQLIRTRSAVKVLAIGLGTSSIFFMSMPWLAANFDYHALIYCRILTGIFQSCINPCVYTLISRWVSPLHRARLGAGILGGNYVGSIIVTFVALIVSANILRFDWPSIFYFFGVVGIIWGILFYSLCSDYPSESGVLRSKNVEASKDNVQNFECSTKTKPITVPWKAILTSAPHWAFVFAYCGNALAFNIFYSYALGGFLRTFLHDFLGMQHVKFYYLPIIGMRLFGYPISFMADYAVSKGARIALVRKICAVIGFWIPAACMIFLATIQISNTNIIICIIVIALGLNSASNCSTQINHLDLAPNFVAPITANIILILILLGISYLEAYVLAYGTNFEDQWRILFFVIAGIYFFSNLFFIIIFKTWTILK